ncbi:MAG: subclass metallo-beta-lactamase [Pseudomonadota bacterium]
MEKKTARFTFACALLVATLHGGAPQAQADAIPASKLAEWNAPQAPFRLYGNTYYVGTRGLASVLVVSDYGHTLIDAGLPETAPIILKNIESLGFRPGDIKAILNTHAHGDHAGGFAAIQQASGAPVYVRRPSEATIRTGRLQKDDPQAHAKAPPMPPVKAVWIVSDEQLLGVGSNRFQAFATPGHTPGGTTWSWDACEKDKCLRMVFADSLSPVSDKQFKFGASKDYPTVLSDFELSYKRLESMPCDVLITPHPEQSAFLERVASRPSSEPAAVKDTEGCRRYAAEFRGKLAARLAAEK